MPIIDLISRKKFEDYLVELIDLVNLFPKAQKFLLAEKILKSAFLVMDDVIEIQYTKKEDRGKIFCNFRLHLEKLKQYQRIAWRKNFINHKTMINQEKKIDEVGRLVSSLCRCSSSSE